MASTSSSYSSRLPSARGPAAASAAGLAGPAVLATRAGGSRRSSVAISPPALAQQRAQAHRAAGASLDAALERSPPGSARAGRRTPPRRPPACARSAPRCGRAREPRLELRRRRVDPAREQLPAPGARRRRDRSAGILERAHRALAEEHAHRPGGALHLHRRMPPRRPRADPRRAAPVSADRRT